MKEMNSDDIKKVSVEILKYIDNVCRINNIRYYLCAGTLLGAIRHGGYIPWDDDIDIMLFREDFEKLSLVWPKDGNYILLSSDNTKKFPYAYNKIIDTRTMKIEPIRNQYQVIGVDVDVFPLDNFPDSEKESIAFIKTIRKEQKKRDRCILQYSKSSSPLRTVKNYIYSIIYGFYNFIEPNLIRRVVKKMQTNAQRYNDIKTNYCGITTLYHYGMGERYPKEYFRGSVLVTFEGEQYPAPIEYNDYLRHMYGDDYLQLPPVEKRNTHHSYKAYWK